jgi:hypothetical protein
MPLFRMQAASMCAPALANLPTLLRHAGSTVVEALALLGPSFEEVPLPGPSAYIKPKAVLYDFNGT